MNHFINLKDVPAKDLQKIVADAKKRKNFRKKLSTLEVDKGAPLKGKLLIQMFEKSSLRTRLSFYLAIKQLGGGTLTLRSNELHLGQGGESIADTAKILSTYGDGFMLRTDSDQKVESFRDHLTYKVRVNRGCHFGYSTQTTWRAGCPSPMPGKAVKFLLNSSG